jgi:hypothetical protein
MSAVKDDLLQTLIDIAFTPRHISEEFARAVREGEAEMESEFEVDDMCAECGDPITNLKDGDYCSDCADTVRAEAFRDNDNEPSDAVEDES